MNVIGASVSEAAPTGAHETRDIVLPNQTEHVSQIAVDVCTNETPHGLFDETTAHFICLFRLVVH